MTVTATQPAEDHDLRWYLLHKRGQELRIRRVFELFRSIGVTPILIKGWAAARFYPNNLPRYSSDIDLAVSGADYKNAQQFLRSKESERLHVDLHREFRHLDTAGWDEILARSSVIDLEGTGVRVPSSEDHLRILSAHWLTDGGANKERLWDIYYAVQNRPTDFDWSICLDSGGPARRNWTIVTIAVAHTVLDLKIDDLPFADEAAAVPEWMMNCLENEWKSEIPLRPLQTCLGSRKSFFQQLRKRIPPNPIQATVDMEGKFDDKSRVFYQMGSMLKRLGPSVKRIAQTLIPSGALRR